MAMNRMYFQRISAALKQARESWRNTTDSTPGDWADDGIPMTEDAKGQAVMGMSKPSGAMLSGLSNLDYDPEESLKQELAYDKEDSKGVPWLMRQVENGQANIQHAYLFEARVNRLGKMLKESSSKDKRPYRIKRVFGTEAFKAQVNRSETVMRAFKESSGKMREDWSDDLWGNSAGGPYDPNQYTEYAPLMGGYFFSQQYLYDMLKGHAYAFEAWNHNPLAHRIINALAQYTLGRRFDWKFNPKTKDKDRKEKAWEDFAKSINLRQRLSKFWIREKLIFGEMFLNIKSWNTLHPATIWEIVTEPTDITNVYYYYRSYPTQYQMFANMPVKGAPGSKDVPSQRYIVEQIPYPQIIHLKSQCTSFEKRGRGTLFPILGWLKRVKDLYQAQITKTQMQSEYAWDVTVKGSGSDVSAFQSANSCIPRGNGNTFVHNEAVTRAPMPVSPTGGRGGDQVVDNVLAFIATSVGFPKDFFNVIASGGGSRATALVGVEPFSKVIEDEQADWEYLLREKIYPEVMRANGLMPDEDDIEFIFPSVTKDTTSEAIKNIQIGKAEGLISNETAGQMFAQEMAITTYDYDEQQTQIKNEQSRGDVLSLGPLPTVGGNDGGADNDGAPGDSPTHGQGKTDLQDDLMSV